MDKNLDLLSKFLKAKADMPKPSAKTLNKKEAPVSNQLLEGIKKTFSGELSPSQPIPAEIQFALDRMEQDYLIKPVPFGLAYKPYECTVKVMGDTNESKASIVLDINKESGLYRMQFKLADNVLEEQGRDFFDIFCAIRRELERKRVMPICYATSLNVYPSQKLRDEELGLLAYRLTPQQPPTPNDVLYIFDTGPDVIPSTVEKQEAYWNDWLKYGRA